MKHSCFAGGFCMWGALPPMWGETPHTPHVFARPPALFAAALGNGIPKDASPLRVTPSRPLSESFGGLCTKNAPASPAERQNPLAASAQKTRQSRQWGNCPCATGCRRTHLRCLRRRGAGGKAFPQWGRVGPFLGCGLWQRGCRKTRPCGKQPSSRLFRNHLAASARKTRCLRGGRMEVLPSQRATLSLQNGLPACEGVS